MFVGPDVDCLSVSKTTVGRQQSAAAVSWSAGSPSQAGCCALLSGDAKINTMRSLCRDNLILYFSDLKHLKPPAFNWC